MDEERKKEEKAKANEERKKEEKAKADEERKILEKATEEKWKMVEKATEEIGEKKKRPTTIDKMFGFLQFTRRNYGNMVNWLVRII